MRVFDSLSAWKYRKMVKVSNMNIYLNIDYYFSNHNNNNITK